jgi:mono/diheme cytochrome c family protein
MSTRIMIAAIAAAAAAGCYLSNGEATGGLPPSGTTDGSTPTTTSSDLPCDVAQVLANCTSCHSSPPVGGAPMALVSYADLTAPAPTDATKTTAEMCVTRMQSTTAPMPPTGDASQTDVATLQSWISAGYPQGTCSGSSTNYNTPLTCTSGTYNHASEGQEMQPGGACNTCHSQQSGDKPPIFSIAGTVYPTAHEYDTCTGVSGVQVVIMDQNDNTQLTLTTNSSGNFTSQASIKKPYRAKVIANGKTREMSASQTDGNCNSCHTESGANGAPGRIMLP